MVQGLEDIIDERTCHASFSAGFLGEKVIHVSLSVIVFCVIPAIAGPFASFCFMKKPSPCFVSTVGSCIFRF